MPIIATIYTQIIKMHRSCDKLEKRVDLVPWIALAALRVVDVKADVGVMRMFAELVWLGDVVRLVDELDDDSEALELPAEELGLRLVAAAEVGPVLALAPRVEAVLVVVPV